jgi:lipopolysaccharide transport system permease protein
MTSAVSKSIRLQKSRGWIGLNFGELWAHHELVYFLTWRDIKVRYKQTALGAAWAILQPVFTMLVFSLFFGKLGGMKSDNVPYPIFAFTALVPWTFFAYGLSQASNSVVASENLIKKVYFPRLVIPLATVMSGAVDFALAFLVLLVMMAYYGVAVTANVIWIPAFVLLTFVTSLGVSLWLAALNVQYRDVRYAIPFLTQFWMFATPIAYPSSLLSDKWRSIYAINPMVGVVDGFRWALLGSGTPPGPTVIVSSAVSLLILIGGAMYFRRMERTFADIA